MKHYELDLYEPDERVYIIDADITGRVQSALIDGADVIYQVRYWHNGESYIVNCSDEELRKP